MWAYTSPTSFLLSEIQEVDGETILIGDCADFEAYGNLPKVLLWEGKLYSLTGWNSDTSRAYWKVTQRVAIPINPEWVKQFSSLLSLVRAMDAESNSPYCWGCGHDRDEDHKADCVLYPGKKSSS